MFVTPNFFLFGSPVLKFIVPWDLVKDITRQNTMRFMSNAILFQLKTEAPYAITSLFFKTNSDERNSIYVFITKCYSPFRTVEIACKPPLKLKTPREVLILGKEIIFDHTHFNPLYFEQQVNLESIWDGYATENAIGDCSFIQSLEFYDYVRKGIPDVYRGHIWNICSGGINKKRIDKRSYKSYLEESVDIKSPLMKQIEIDLKRSLSEHSYFRTNTGITSLRNVLRAYSVKNPVVGYCQAMNFITCALLLFMEEEDAFWVLSAICEDIVPSNYRPQMMGALVEQKIFEYLLEFFIPEVANHCKVKDVPISIISGQWFLSLSIGNAPLEVSFRILDCWLCINKEYSYRTALALISIQKEFILKSSIEKIQTIFKNNNFTADQLIEVAYKQYDKLPTDKINDIRNEHQFNLIKDLHTETKYKFLSSLKDETQFSNDEVIYLYDLFHQSLTIMSDHLLSIEAFKKNIFPPLFSNWLDSTIPNLPHLVFTVFDKDGDQFLNIVEYLSGLNSIFKGTLLQVWNICFNIRMLGIEIGNQVLTYEELQDIIYLFLRLYSKEKDIPRVTQKNIQTYLDQRKDLKFFEPITEEPLLSNLLLFFNLESEISLKLN
uniref:Rab-GAP TBC domain-containing protein n=1 Tax=Arcella intermedia TaxID=1963864 RepID=A0A6B2KZS6_9EUKA